MSDTDNDSHDPCASSNSGLDCLILREDSL
jgi:hypothetical protein